MALEQKSETPSDVPSQLGKYRLLGQLGRGGMADVFLAVASGPAGFNKLHVLKLLRQELFDNNEALHMFANEARVAALLNHPNVVQTYEVGEDQGTVFLVMEYLEGQSMHSVLKRSQRGNSAGGLSMGMRLRIVSDVLGGLHHAHELRDLTGEPLNLVHRDVSPQNIFVTYDGGIKLLDFGVAKTTSTSSSTRIGTIKGKVGYMAPEQVNSPSLVSRRTDLFQMGLLLWEGVVGRRVWEGLTDYEVLLKLANNVMPGVVPPPDADPELVRICQNAIAMAPDARYPTAEAFADDLEAYMTAREIRITGRDVGAFVARQFAERREELREAVQERLQEMQAESGHANQRVLSGMTPLLSGALGPQTSSSRCEYVRAGLVSSTGAVEHSTTRAPRRTGVTVAAEPRKMMRWQRAAVATAVLGALAALSVFATGKGEQPATAPPVASQPSLGEGQQNLAEFSVTAMPSNAQLYLDNAPLPSNPFRRRVAKDSAVHVVRAEAPGHESASLVVRFDRDSDTMITLPPTHASVPATPPAASPTVARESRSPSPRVSVAARGKSPTPAVPSTKPKPETPTATAAPPAVKLDNSDPWR